MSDGDAHTEQDVVILNEQVLSNVLVHPSFNIRLLALSLLISSPSTTKPYSSNVLALLRKHLPLYHTDADAKFRFETFVREKAMLRRICGCLGAVHKKISDHHSRLRKQHTQQGGEANQTVGADDARAFGRLVYNRDLHLDFLVWYFDFLSYEMAPTASYQRHISALKLLNWLLKPEHLPTVVDPDRLTRLTSMRWVRSLLDLLLDPFDDVRGIAAQIVSVLPLSKDGTASRQLEEMDAEVLLPDLRKSYDRAQKMAVKTGRASHADGAARAAWLLFVHTRRMSDQVPLISALVGELERKLRHADDNLGLAAIESPVHGDFSSLW